MYKERNFTPKQLVSELDKYIVGQSEAKKNVAVALRNRWRRMRVSDDIKNDIIPNNILMIGDTGVGKTEIARRLAKIVRVPFIKVEASKFTEVGYVGRDVESMVRDLVENAIQTVRSLKKNDLEDHALKAVEEAILDKIIDIKRYINSSGTAPLEIIDKKESYRTKYRLGELDDILIDVEITKESPNLAAFPIPGMNHANIPGIADLMNMMNPNKSKRKKMSVKDAKKVLLEEEYTKMIDTEDLHETAIKLAENSGIIFIDEIDKIASNAAQKNGPNISREGVQRDLLPIIEGCSVSTKYGSINTDHILFIAAGAFHFAKPSDLIPELQGRLPIRVELSKLTHDDFIRILKEPKSSLLNQYIALFKAEGVSLTFDDDAIDEIAKVAFVANSEVENIGARRLHTVLSYLLKDFLFVMPEELTPNSKIIITLPIVKEKLSSMMQVSNFNQFII